MNIKFGQYHKNNTLQIKTIQDLPVGMNLQDHIGIGGIMFTLSDKVSLVQTRYENTPSVLQYAIFGQGLPLTKKFFLFH